MPKKDASISAEQVMRAKSIVQAVIAAFAGNEAGKIDEPTYALEAACDLLDAALHNMEAAPGLKVVRP